MTWQQFGRWRGVTTILLLAVGAAGAWNLRPHVVVAETESSRADHPSSSAFQGQGSVSCAAAACHNQGGPAGSKGSEYSTWLMNDPHHRAYSVLLDARSRRIATNLKRGKEAHEDTLCLNCHVHPDMEATPPAERSVVVRDGVGCESCHGPAQAWLTEHYLPQFQQKSIREKQALGMYPTKDLTVRARACAGCHIGSADREVNHDLIAAGHPRMRFEYAAFLAVMPKHWDARAEKAQYPGFEARVWAIGQAASAQTALELLASRADPQHNKPWPEFAEYDCFACHHELLGVSRRQHRQEHDQPQDREGKPVFGSLPWGTWYMAMPRVLAGGQLDGDPAVTTALEQLGDNMGRRYPDRNKVAQRARQAAGQLGSWLDRLTRANYGDEARLHELFASLARDQDLARANWDGSAQLYLALAALYQAEGDLDARQRNPQLKTDLVAMRRQLEFLHGGPIKYDSPHEQEYGGREKRFLDALNHIQQLDK